MMIFNPLFLQVINGDQSAQSVKTGKQSNPANIFSDIIKVSVAKTDSGETSLNPEINQINKIKQNELPAADLLQNSATILQNLTLNLQPENLQNEKSGEINIEQLVSSILNDELEISGDAKSNEKKSENINSVETLLLNENNVIELISGLMNNPEFQNKFNIILNENLNGKFQEFSEKLKNANPEEILNLLKKGNVISLENSDEKNSKGMLISLIERSNVNNSQAVLQEEENLLTGKTTSKPNYELKLIPLEESENAQKTLNGNFTGNAKISENIEEINTFLKTIGKQNSSEKIEIAGEKLNPAAKVETGNHIKLNNESVFNNDNNSTGKLNSENPENGNSFIKNSTTEKLNIPKNELPEIKNIIYSEKTSKEIIENKNLKVGNNPVNIASNEDQVKTEKSEITFNTKNIPENKINPEQKITPEILTGKSPEISKVFSENIGQSELKKSPANEINIENKFPSENKIQLENETSGELKVQNLPKEENRNFEKTNTDKVKAEVNVKEVNQTLSDSKNFSGENNLKNREQKLTAEIKSENVKENSVNAEFKNELNLSSTKEIKNENAEKTNSINIESKPEAGKPEFTANESKIENEFNIKEKIAEPKSNLNQQILKTVKAAEIMKEVSQFIQQKNTGSMILKVSPENLGNIKIALEIIDEVVSAKIEVNNSAAREVLENNVKQLQNSLSQNGVQVNSINISLSNFDQKQNKNFVPNKRKSYGYSDEKEVEETSKTNDRKLGYNTMEYLA